jgi:hypothetical protein
MSGAGGREVSRQFKISHVSIWRHRTNHIEKPAQHRLAIINKGADERRERDALAKAAASDKPLIQEQIDAVFGAAAHADGYTKIQNHLDFHAEQAVINQQPMVGVAVAGRQIQLLDHGAKYAGGAFTPGRSPDQVAAATRFEVNILFSNGKQETISVSTPAVPHAVIDQADRDANTGDAEQAPDPEYDPVDLLRE